MATSDEQLAHLPAAPRALFGRSRDLLKPGRPKARPMVVGFLLLYLSLLTACFARAYEVLFIPASCLLALGLWSLAQGIRTWLRDREGYRNAFRYGKPIVAKVVAANGEPDIETWSEYLGWEFHVGGVRYSGTAHVDRQRESWSISDLLECETVVVLYDPENPQYHALHAG